MSADGYGNAADEEISNTSANESFQDVLQRRLSRRGVLKGLGLAAS